MEVYGNLFVVLIALKNYTSEIKQQLVFAGTMSQLICNMLLNMFSFYTGCMLFYLWFLSVSPSIFLSRMPTFPCFTPSSLHLFLTTFFLTSLQRKRTWTSSWLILRDRRRSRGRWRSLYQKKFPTQTGVSKVQEQLHSNLAPVVWYYLKPTTKPCN